MSQLIDVITTVFGWLAILTDYFLSFPFTG